MKINQHINIPENPLPIVIIGAGGIVKDAHLPAYDLAGFPVLGIYDIDLKKAAHLKELFPSIKKTYQSLTGAITDAKNNSAVVDIAVPVQYIAEILQQLPNGTPVLIQKPMGENLEQAQTILSICAQKKLVAAVNFQMRFSPYFMAATDMIQQGLLGTIYDVEFKINVATPWQLWDFLFQLPRVEILYHSIHYLDWIRTLLGNPEQVYASTLQHPKMKELSSTRSTMILDYDAVTQARVLTNHGHTFGAKYQESYVKIEGTKGAIKIRIGVYLEYPKGLPDVFEYCLLNDKKGWQEIPLEGSWFPHAFSGSMAALQNHVLDPKIPLVHSVKDAFETMRLVEAMYDSSDTKGLNFKNFGTS